MSFSGILAAFSRLSVQTLRSSTRNISTNVNPLCFQATNVLYGEPLKKKKRIDPTIIRNREERKKKKIEKSIRRLEKISRQLKPINEVEVPFKLIDQKKQRTRKKPNLSPEQEEERVLLQKTWARYKVRQHLEDIQMIDTVMMSQQKALDELRAESEELYQEAMQPDFTLIPHIAQGPVHTPPIKDYRTPDGDYIDISRKFEGEETQMQKK